MTPDSPAYAACMQGLQAVAYVDRKIRLVCSDILVPKLFLVLIPIPFRRIYFTSSSEIIIVLVPILISVRY